MMSPLDVVHSTSTYSKPRGDCRLPKLKATAADLESWFAGAAAGDALEYHRGVLAMDRAVGSRLGDDDREELQRVADIVMTFAKFGYGHLVQQRHGPDDYTYLAIASSSIRSRPDRKLMSETAS